MRTYVSFATIVVMALSTMVHAQPPVDSVLKTSEHVLAISCFSGGDPQTNPPGYAPWWADPVAGTDELLERLTEGYAAGIRRFMLNRPMGRGYVSTPDGQVFVSFFVPGASWHTLEPERREELQSRLRIWIGVHLDAEVGVFVGMRARTPHTSFTAFNREGWLSECALMDLEDPDGAHLARTTLGGWLACGVTAFYFDASSHPENRESLVQLKEALAPLGVRVVGEAIPSTPDPNGEKSPDSEWSHRVGWLATESFIRLCYPPEHEVPEGADLYDWVTWTGPNHDLSDPEERHALARLRVTQGYTIIAGLDTILALD